MSSSTKSSSCPWLLSCVFNKVDIKPTMSCQPQITTITHKLHGKLSLEQLVIDKLTWDANSCREAMNILPTILIEKLLIAALFKARDSIVVELIQAWKHQSICLSSILLSNYPIGNNYFVENYMSITSNNLPNGRWNKIMWILLNAIESNAPETLKHLDLTRLPMTYICDVEGEESKLNLLTKSNILREIKQKGITISLDICIENWSSWENVKDVLTFPPSTICVHQFDENKDSSLKDFPIIEVGKVKRLNISHVVPHSEKLLNVLSQFNNLKELSLNFFPTEVSFIKLCELLNIQTNLERLSLEILEGGELGGLIKNVPLLTNLTFLKVSILNINQQDEESLALCTKLQHLSIESGKIIQDFNSFKSRFESILSNLPELQYLDINLQETPISSDFIVSIAKKCSKLIGFRIEKISEEEFFGKFKWKDAMVNNLKWLIVIFATEDEFIRSSSQSTEEFRVVCQYDGPGTGTGILTARAKHFMPPMGFRSILE